MGYSLLALFLALASVDASPAFHQITELVKSQSRDGDPDFVAYYKEPSKKIDNPKLNRVYHRWDGCIPVRYPAVRPV